MPRYAQFIRQAANDARPHLREEIAVLARVPTGDVLSHGTIKNIQLHAGGQKKYIFYLGSNFTKRYYQRQ